MLGELDFKGETEGKICSICKLHLEDNQQIVYCPNCESLFHFEHLVEWLRINSECPVCERDFSLEIEKYQIRPRKESKDVEELFSHAPRPKRFTNPNRHKVNQGSYLGMIVFGFIFAFSWVIIIALMVPFPNSLGFIIPGYFFGLAGMGVMSYGFKNFRKEVSNNWKDITFSNDRIILTNGAFPTEDIDPKTIQRILLYLSTPTTDSGRLIAYEIVLNIYCANKKAYNLGTIYKSKDDVERMYLFEKLLAQIEETYGITPITKPMLVKEFFRNYRYTILISIFVYAGVSVIFSIIGNLI